MTSPESALAREVAALRAELRSLADRVEIRELFDRYVAALDTVDEESYDDAWFRTVFTDDVRLVFPVGDHRGVTGLCAFQRTAKARWARTHHIGANCVVDVTGDRAAVRSHQLATHSHRDDPRTTEHLSVGGHYTAEAVRTDAGWRFSRMEFHPVWLAGPRHPSLAHLGI
ncbi:nuclear transport factor 2 family protein [Streptosporangium nondiastaticum]|uniref:Nuclear transport factor 2 family protein n=1 Tax=Streptosporangium nondiastaticum TaxID=35764 RepID=A0A9X7JK91_9ACTN|nr:nuclear transport factor 2 family protein [Streptosporangium nondiastaticum]PSJ25308.1 nuclear transport factor 2 family protein [Streptosporangium nondiastaticum]